MSAEVGCLYLSSFEIPVITKINFIANSQAQRWIVPLSPILSVFQLGISGLMIARCSTIVSAERHLLHYTIWFDERDLRA